MSYKYANTGSPFNFLGRVSESQRDSFYEWIDKQSPLSPECSVWYQVRAQQLRKTAGILEHIYSKQELKPTFEKTSWKPGKDGHLTGNPDRNATPATVVSRIKQRFQPMLQRDDEAVFWMNWVRTQIERAEDAATMQAESKQDVDALKTELTALFDKPEYESTLVKDKTKLYKGEPYFRVNSLDEPTAWEKEHTGRGQTSSVI